MFLGKIERKTISLNGAINFFLKKTFETTSSYFIAEEQTIKKRKIIWLHVNLFDKAKMLCQLSFYSNPIKS